jgi:type IV pilus assembly protein PilM
VGKEIVGLRIGASRLAAARVETNGSVRLNQIADAPLPPGLVAGGEVRDRAGLAAALKQFFSEHKLPRKNVRLGIASNRIGVRTIELQGIDDERQIANAVRFRAQEVLPIPLAEAVLDYQVLGETPGEDGGPAVKRVLLVVAYRDLVAGYVEAARIAGIRLAGIDLEAFALLRALTPVEPPEGDPSALVAVAIGSERSTLAVSDGSTCEFTRVLEWGGQALTTALARDLELEPQDAERLKRAAGLEGEASVDGFTDEQVTAARAALRTALQTFARELVSSLQFYQSQEDSLGIREVVLAGGAAQLPGLAPALHRLVGVPVRVGDPLAGVAVSRRVKAELTPSLAIPVGLGMGL